LFRKTGGRTYHALSDVISCSGKLEGEHIHALSDVISCPGKLEGERIHALSDAFFVQENWRENVSTELLAYQEQIVIALQEGYDGADYVNETYDWPFSGAFLYSLTVITTIGEWHDT
jgi:hypothetical protein